jgi:hypothetical protein
VAGPAPHTTLGPFVSYLSSNLVIVTWQTDEPSTSFVNYGVASVLEQGVVDVSLVTTHVVFLTNLQPGTSYGFQFGSSDAAGNTMIDGQPAPGFAAPLGVSRLESDQRLGVVTLGAGTILAQAASPAVFTTPADADTTPPSIVSGPSIALLASDRVLIQAVTSEAASLLAQFAVGALTGSAFEPSFTESPSLVLTGLQPDTTYQLSLVFTDPKGNRLTMPGLSFTTPAAPDQTPPDLTGVATGTVTATSALVTWTTDEPADSIVRFGLQGSALTLEAGQLGLRTQHSVALSSLSPGTAYAVEARSRDASGNLGTAPGPGFTTAALGPVISSVAPNVLTQGATTIVALNGERFEAGAVVSVTGPAGLTVGTTTVNALGSQIQAAVTVSDSAALGGRTLVVTNPGSTLSASAGITIVDELPPTITITNPAENAELLTTSVTVTGTLNESGTVTVNGEAAGTGTSFSKSITLPGPGLHTITVTATDGSGNVGTATRNVKVMTVTIADAAPVTEGDSGSVNALFTLMLSAPSAGTVSVTYQTANGSATAGSDYTGGPGSASFPVGATTTTIAVPVLGDTLDEGTEGFVVNLTGATGATITDPQGAATILDDDGPPTVSVADAPPVTEGNSGTTPASFVVTLSGASGQPVTVNFATADGTAQQPADYVAITGGSVTLPAGTTSTTVTVSVRGDAAFENDEGFFLNLTGATNATLGDAQGQATILNDDPAGPSLSIGDTVTLEHIDGSTLAVFAVRLSAPAPAPVTVAYATADGTATAAGGDYVAKSGTLSFPTGAVLRLVSVTVKGDAALEGDETFFVNLSAPSGASIADPQGQATIRELSLTIDDVSVAEGNSGTRNAVFTVRLSYPTLQAVRVDYRTLNGTAVAPGDYKAKSGTVTFLLGATQRTIAIAVKGDRTTEPNETFLVELLNPRKAVIADPQGQGTIVNDDP